MAIFGTTTIGDILYQWQALGVFAYLLPFLLIFAIVFGILNSTKLLGKNRGVQATIALAVGLLAIQSAYVTGFFQNIFPYTGIGIAILLMAVILTGIAFPHQPRLIWFYLVLGIVIFVVIVGSMFPQIYWLSGVGYGLTDSVPIILALIITVVALYLIIRGSNSNGP